MFFITFLSRQSKPELTSSSHTHTHTRVLRLIVRLGMKNKKKRLYFYTLNDALVEVMIGADRQKVNKPYINFSSPPLVLLS